MIKVSSKIPQRIKKMNPKTSLGVAPSKLKKIFYKSERQTGYAALRGTGKEKSRRVLSIEEQDAYQNKKMERRVVQTSTGRVMDIMGVHNKQMRKNLNVAVQELINSRQTKIDRQKFIKKLRQNLSPKDANIFNDLIEKSVNINWDRLH